MTPVNVTTAVPLATKDQKKISQEIRKKIDGSPEFVFNVDPTIVGGIRVTIGSQRYDASTKHKLSTLKEQLLNL